MRDGASASARWRGECTRFMPGIACGRCVARAPRSRRCADPRASMQPSLKERCCVVASPDEQRAERRASLAPSPRRRASLFLQPSFALSMLHDSNASVSSLCSSMTRLSTTPRRSARTAVLALLDRSLYRIKEPRQQPNEDSQRGPRRPPPIPYRAPHHRACGFARPQSFTVAKIHGR